MCVASFDRRRQKKARYKGSTGAKYRRPGRLTTCADGLGFQRQTCLQPQQCTAVDTPTELVVLLVVDVSSTYSIHTGVMKNAAAT